MCLCVCVCVCLYVCICMYKVESSGQLLLCRGLKSLFAVCRTCCYIHTPWSRVLLDKLTSSQLVKKFPGFYGIRMFLTAFTSACHLSLSWVRLIQCVPPPSHFQKIHLILSSHLCLGLPSGAFPWISLQKPCIHLSSPPYVLHAPPISFFSIWPQTNVWWGV